VKACEAHPLVCGLFPDVNQTCRPLLAKIPKTAGKRRKFPGEIAAQPMKIRENQFRKLLKFHERGFGKFPKFPLGSQEKSS
jgi:hypothetical protein